ncbi:MAG: transcriptional regulator [Alphaproteobacteria bacterium]|nr:MAG: transcriptional regulator [Alphaproteobacteria bacterium]
MNPIFSQYQNEDVRRLIAEYPLAWIISPMATTSAASLLPLIGKYDAGGTLIALIGHMAVANPLNAVFTDNPTAMILFNGPQGYISPNYAGPRNWGPTWNYATLRIEAQIHMGKDMTEYALGVLIDQCEKHLKQPWTATELEGRYEGLLTFIIGFEAKIDALHATFKLGQDEKISIINNIIDAHPDPELRTWMQSFKNKDGL